jgi:hypothetical protein
MLTRPRRDPKGRSERSARLGRSDLASQPCGCRKCHPAWLTRSFPQLVARKAMWKISVVSVESAARELAIRGGQWGFVGSPPTNDRPRLRLPPRGADKMAPFIPTKLRRLCRPASILGLFGSICALSNAGSSPAMTGSTGRTGRGRNQGALREALLANRAARFLSPGRRCPEARPSLSGDGSPRATRTCDEREAV